VPIIAIEEHVVVQSTVAPGDASRWDARHSPRLTLGRPAITGEGDSNARCSLPVLYPLVWSVCFEQGARSGELNGVQA
jgi:hypothetical protein